jgi:tRNA (Thr-GGU) A37 N-methylase
MSVVRLLRRDGCLLHVADVDILDDTPLLDLKPYVPEFDAHPASKAGWFDACGVDRRLADGRFQRTTPPVPRKRP